MLCLTVPVISESLLCPGQSCAGACGTGEEAGIAAVGAPRPSVAGPLSRQRLVAFYGATLWPGQLGLQRDGPSPLGPTGHPHRGLSVDRKLVARLAPRLSAAPQLGSAAAGHGRAPCRGPHLHVCFQRSQLRQPLVQMPASGSSQGWRRSQGSGSLQHPKEVLGARKGEQTRGCFGGAPASA